MNASKFKNFTCRATYILPESVSFDEVVQFTEAGLAIYSKTYQHANTEQTQTPTVFWSAED
jgi:hypothetical protein